MATQIDELTKNTDDAQQAVTEQTGIVHRLESSVTSLQAELDAAQQNINTGQGTDVDLEVIGLHPSKITAQSNALARAREELARRQHTHAMHAARQWVEETLRDNPDNLGERAAQIKADGVERMTKIHREVTEQLAALEDERANLERTAVELSRAIEERPTMTSTWAGLELMHGSRSIVGLNGARMYLDGSVRDDTYGADTGAQMDREHWSIGRNPTPAPVPEWLASLAPSTV
ncbi:hypothetical protein M3C26_05135 [Kocuria rhizophila]|uniref:hypothetical protein n=1 Tax=Kocuria rhizophila TaxID=72000 RepID=UPI0021A60A26|nr:hypothetical protein [Kocuria rhizophila]MCT1880176.1 hypothetical protein [Kocuria rhizophila]